MNVGAALDDALDGVGRQFAAGAAHGEHFCAVGKKFRRAAFIGFHVGQFVADDAVIGLAQRRQRKGVGGGAIEDEKHFATSFEDIADQVGGLLRPRVVAVGSGVAVIGLLHGRPRFGTNPGVIIAGELAAGRCGGAVRRVAFYDRHGGGLIRSRP